MLNAQYRKCILGKMNCSLMYVWILKIYPFIQMLRLMEELENAFLFKHLKK